MLSIIVSSYKEDDFNQFSKNVKETIGDDFQYEIIQQWNPGIIGICEAYNKGAEKSKYENFTFNNNFISASTVLRKKANEYGGKPKNCRF